MLAHRAEILKDATVLRALSAQEAGAVARVMEEVDLAAGQTVFVEGEPGDRFYIVEAGLLEVVKALGTEEQRRLAERGPGEYFGEMSLFDPAGLRTATVRAITPARLLSLHRADFQNLLKAHPALAFEMLRVLTLQLRDNNNATITDLRSKNSELATAYAELKAAQAQIIEKEKLEQELRTAKRIQQSILPSALPQLAGYSFGAFIAPARSVGGDLYDFIPLDDGRLGIAVGDVSDKGVPAAIFMALTRSLLRAEATRVSSPRLALERVNRLLLDMNEDGMFVTLLYGILDAEQRTFTYTRAGHEVPLRILPSGDVRLAERGTGAPLGVFAEIGLDERTVVLAPGETLLIYSDGATDVIDFSEALYGIDRLRATAAGAAGAATAQEFCSTLWSDLEAYRGEAAQADDVTLVALRRE
ncbi:MAG: SpoIIE family protein phosphatase [Anaerolineae bacterium]|nr:SpoIIE family protein phosphatase [Anaerolineae bacterium]